MGWIRLTANDAGLTSLYFRDPEPGIESNPNHPVIAQTVEQLNEWFAGARTEFDLPLNMQGTEFQLRVWNTLLEIPFGKTWSYLDLALRMGDRNATRAVGSANGKNPISLIVPCHSVIGSNGKLTGYGGGIERKKWLLEFENALYQPELF